PVPTTEPPPPEPPPTIVVDRGRGRTLSVGVAPPAPSPATVADAVGSRVPLYSAPHQDEPDDWLDNPTWEGLPVVFLVHGRSGDWLNVQVSIRPNQATAWVRASDVALRQVTQRVVVDISARTLTAYDGDRVLMQVPVAPGLSSTPTPRGDFFVDGAVALRDPTGPYGSHQISVAAFSDVHYSFGGGIGQIAIHGTNNPALIGTPASNGCVRMTNADVAALASMVPIGTPVKIV
ncbi:MAG TPA: L,D-transpeptidase family protein, partial [Acidimicrobiales bacterium]|nr:L,D-transpeptidase family protein [Acidimicrobiales bacterium]